MSLYLSAVYMSSPLSLSSTSSSIDLTLYILVKLKQIKPEVVTDKLVAEYAKKNGLLTALRFLEQHEPKSIKQFQKMVKKSINLKRFIKYYKSNKYDEVLKYIKFLKRLNKKQRYQFVFKCVINIHKLVVITCVNKKQFKLNNKVLKMMLENPNYKLKKCFSLFMQNKEKINDLKNIFSLYVRGVIAPYYFLFYVRISKKKWRKIGQLDELKCIDNFTNGTTVHLKYQIRYYPMLYECTFLNK